MRTLLVTAFLFACGTAASSNYASIDEAVKDERLLETIGVPRADTRMSSKCSAAVLETDDPPEFFDCVYVQTSKDLNLYSLEDGYLMSELQLKLHAMDGVALQRMGRYAQVQIFSRNRVTALYIHGKGWIDPAQTESVYRWLLENGVRERPARKWIGP
jgi:hypothetical protein